MGKVFTPKVVTANHLLSGDAIYWSEGGDWVLAHEEATLFTDPDAADAALAEAASQASVVVGAYLADAVAGPEGPKPVHFREAFRTRGPSNYNHGKQAEVSHV